MRSIFLPESYIDCYCIDIQLVQKYERKLRTKIEPIKVTQNENGLYVHFFVTPLRIKAVLRGQSLTG